MKSLKELLEAKLDKDEITEEIYYFIMKNFTIRKGGLDISPEPNENGKYDFEALECVDLELFNRQMKELLEGKEVEQGDPWGYRHQCLPLWISSITTL